MAAFWQGLTGQTYGASFDKEPMTREELLSEAREREAEMAAAAPNPNSSDAGKADNRAARFHENDEQKRTRVLSDVYVNACLQGEHVTSAAYWQGKPDRIEKHTADNCQHLLPSGLPCHHNLWAGGKPELESHLQQFMGLARKQRSQAVYDELSPFSWHCPPLPDGSRDPTGVPSWHFFMNDRIILQASVRDEQSNWCFQVRVDLLTLVFFKHFELEVGYASMIFFQDYSATFCNAFEIVRGMIFA